MMDSQSQIRESLKRAALAPYFWWWVVLGIASYFVLLTFGDYGVSWDEVFRSNGGEQKLAYYEALTSGDMDRASELRGKTDRYPGLFDLSLALLRRISPFNDVSTGHLWSATFGLLGILGTMFLGRAMGGPWVGLLAGILLVFCPRYWGHMFINPKDIPFAATFVFGVWCLLRTYNQHRLQWQSALVFGLAAGACMSVRVGGLLLFCYAGLFLSVRSLITCSKLNWNGSASLVEVLSTLKWLSLSGICGFIVLFIFWPSMHVNPFAATAATLSEVTDFGWQGRVLFDGVWMAVDNAPPYYLLRWLFITVPDSWLYIAGSLMLVLVWRLIIKDMNQRWHELIKYLWVLFFALFPVAYILLRGSTVYDGMRHILFVLPLLAALLGGLTVVAFNWLRQYRQILRLWILVLVLLFTRVGWDVFCLHPYQYIYFNQMNGGLAVNGQHYDTDYWGTAYKEAVEVLADELPRKLDGTSWRITMEPPIDLLIERLGKPVVPPPALVEPFLRGDFDLVSGTHAPEIYIATTRNGYNTMREGRLLCQVQRSGIALCEVKLLVINDHAD